MVVVFNKCDAENSDLLVSWMKDYDKYLVKKSEITMVFLKKT